MSKYIPNVPFLKGRPVNLEEDDYYSESKQAKVQFYMVGPVGSAKSTIAAGTVVTCETLSIILKGFYARVLPRSSYIIADANNLRLGRFPKKTDPLAPRAAEAGLLICEQGWREKRVHVPMYDVGGEIFDAFNVTPEIQARVNNYNRNVVNAIRDSEGYVVTLSAPDALMFRKSYKEQDVDQYTYNVLSQAFAYKKQAHKKIEGIALWLTRWDEVMDKAKDIGMDIYEMDDNGRPNQKGLMRFFNNGYPGIAMLLKPLVNQGKVKFFRSYFKIKKKEDGVTEETWPLDLDDLDHKPQKVINTIVDDTNYIRSKPEYSEQDYADFIRFMGTFSK